MFGLVSQLEKDWIKNVVSRLRKNITKCLQCPHVLSCDACLTGQYPVYRKILMHDSLYHHYLIYTELLFKNTFACLLTVVILPDLG